MVDRTKLVSIAGLTGGSLAFLAFALRAWARLSGTGGSVGLDDICLFGTIVCAGNLFYSQALTTIVAQYSIYSVLLHS
jgi:hypothetical protein